MKVLFLCPFWGQEHLSPGDFLQKVKNAGYDGVEIHLPDNETWVSSFARELNSLRSQRPFFVVAQCIPSHEPGETVEDFLHKTRQHLQAATRIAPDLINSHTGTDYFSFEDNCRCIEACTLFSEEKGTEVLHETHRGRFSFHAPTLIPYLDRFPLLSLTADFSHFCVVSERMLQGQEAVLAQVAARSAHVHARVGFEQAPQVADPFAPEWEDHLARFTAWWSDLIQARQQAGQKVLTITPECGPAPYMPRLPFTNQPIGDQWSINLRMMTHLRALFT